MYKPKKVNIMFFIRASKSVKQDFLTYLDHVRMLRLKFHPLDLFRWSPNNKVFLNDWPSMPMDRDIDFCIDLEPSTHLISILPYCIAFAEFREIKDQIQKFLNKSFIRPCASPWGAPILFFKKDCSRRM